MRIVEIVDEIAVAESRACTFRGVSGIPSQARHLARNEPHSEIPRFTRNEAGSQQRKRGWLFSDIRSDGEPKNISRAANPFRPLARLTIPIVCRHGPHYRK